MEAQSFWRSGKAAGPEARPLASRGRETADSIQSRLDRSVATGLPASTVEIDNSGALDVAGAQFARLLGDAPVVESLGRQR